MRKLISAILLAVVALAALGPITIPVQAQSTCTASNSYSITTEGKYAFFWTGAEGWGAINDDFYNYGLTIYGTGPNMQIWYLNSARTTWTNLYNGAVSGSFSYVFSVHTGAIWVATDNVDYGSFTSAVLCSNGGTPTVAGPTPTPTATMTSGSDIPGSNNLVARYLGRQTITLPAGSAIWGGINVTIPDFNVDDFYGVIVNTISETNSALELKPMDSGDASIFASGSYDVSGGSKCFAPTLKNGCSSFGYTNTYTGGNGFELSGAVARFEYGWSQDQQIVFDLYAIVDSDSFDNGTCQPDAIQSTADLVESGTVIAGSLQAVDVADYPEAFDQIDVTLSYTFPPITGTGEAFIQGSMIYGVLNGGYSFEGATIWVNGMEYTGSPAKLINIGIPAGTTELTVRFVASIRGDGADQSLYPLAELAYIRVGIPTVNTGQQLICDGGMENIPEIDGTTWEMLSEDRSFGRLGLGLAAFINDIAEGGPACGDGYQVVARHPPLLNAYISSPIYHTFNWPGGTMYYKFRYRSRDLLGFAPGSPNVYLVRQGGEFVVDLYGSNVFDPYLAVQPWTYISGSINLDAGFYNIVLDAGYVDADITKTNAVYYDDVAVGIYPQIDMCTISVEDVLLQPTPTITLSPTVTVSPTITQTGTLNPTRTNTGVPTLKPSQTRTPTRAATGTPRNTATLRASATLNPGTATARASATRATSTPFGQTTPIPTLNGTQISNTSTSVAQGTPNPSVTPGSSNPTGGDTWWPGGSNPGGWTGNPVVDCARPGFWDWINVNKWMDYEFCSLVSFVSFGSIQQATAQAIPSRFNEYEPFGTINEMQQGIVALRTQAAGYAWNQTGVEGVNDTLDPSRFLQAPGAPDAWAEGAEPFDFTPGSAQSRLTVTEEYFQYCNTKMSSLFSGNLAKGSCYALGFARRIGLLPWVQFFLNLAAFVTMLRSFLGFIGMAPSYAMLVSADSDKRG